MLSDYLIMVPVLAIASIASVKTGKLTAIAGLTGFTGALLIFAGAGCTGIAMLAAFFVLGTAATSLGMNEKYKLGIAEKNKGRRTAGQVMANAGVAAAMALLVLILPQQAGLFQLMIAASFASAAADTLSSELGNLYGKRFYNILTFKKDKRGLDGVVSAEGTLAGLVGSVIIALIYSAKFSFGKETVWIIIAGTAGNLFDSVLGASLERRHQLNNNAVNFLNTAIAAFIALLLYYLQ